MSDDPYIKAMFGRHAIHVPMNFIVQDMSTEKDKTILAVAQATGPAIEPIFFGKPSTHTLIIGDVIIRPRIVVGSEHLVGSGISGIATYGFADINAWLSKGVVRLSQ